MIEARGLRKQFGTVVAVDEVSFAAADQNITGIVGPNGAGKTTTLRMLSTLVQPDRGRVVIDGLSDETPPEQRRARLGILPDATGLYPRLTAREHLRYFGELQGLSGKPLEQRVQALIDRLDLAKFAERRANGYSHGERMKVCLARALIHDPPNVILDEPTNGLDVMSIRALRALLRQLRAEGRCILFSSHVMSEVSALCDRIVVIAQGRVVADGTPQEVRASVGETDLEEAFVRLVGLDTPPASGTVS